MTQIILILIGIAIVVILLMKKTRERVVGICSSALDRTVKKTANKNRALEFLQNKGKAGNEEIREYLGVSRQSAVRYMAELEKEGKVRQIGEFGRSVTYRLNDPIDWVI